MKTITIHDIPKLDALCARKVATRTPRAEHRHNASRALIRQRCDEMRKRMGLPEVQWP